MQAIMMDTWTGRAIYDSIVNVKRDSDFLSKNGNTASIQLPIKMLQANNAPVKPLDILFRTKEDVWGDPAIAITW